MEQSTSVSLQEVKQAANDYLLLDDENLVEIPLAVFVANKLPADPLWMFITGPPSNAKTEILMAMNGHSQTKFLSSLTPNTLISGKETKDKDGNKVNCSLLPKLDGKLVVIKDFTTVLNMRDDVKAQILSQLREVYDGQTSKAFGTGEFFNWKGKIGVIAAVTPIIDKYTSVHQLLGERFLHYRTDNAKRLATAKRSMANMLADDCQRDKFHAAMTGFIQRFSEPFDVVLQENETLNDRIAALADFCATARTGVSRSRHDQTVDVLPQAEGPARLAKQFKLLASGLALVRGLTEIDEAVYAVVRKVARDTIPSLRLKVLDALWTLYQKEKRWYTTKEVAMKAGVPTTTAKLKLGNMHLLGLLERDLDGDADTAPYIWVPSFYLTEAVQDTNCLTNKNGEGGKKEEI